MRSGLAKSSIVDQVLVVTDACASAIFVLEMSAACEAPEVGLALFPETVSGISVSPGD